MRGAERGAFFLQKKESSSFKLHQQQHDVRGKIVHGKLYQINADAAVIFFFFTVLPLAVVAYTLN